MDTNNDTNPLRNLIHHLEYFTPDQNTSTLVNPHLKAITHAHGVVRVQTQHQAGHRIVFQVGNHVFQEIVKSAGNGVNNNGIRGIMIAQSSLAEMGRNMDTVIATGIRYTFCAHVHRMDDEGFARACHARNRARLINSCEEEKEHAGVFRCFPPGQDPRQLSQETLVVVDTCPRIVVTTLHVRPQDHAILVTVSSVIVSKA